MYLCRAAVRLNSCKMIGSKVLSTAPPQKLLPGADKRDRLVWFDLEMTGLEAEDHHIMEAACLVTDSELNVLGEGVNVIIHQPDEILNKMSDWCKTHFGGESGLWESCKKSNISLHQAEDMILSYLEEHTIKGASPLAGNSVFYDRIFIRKYMPRVNAHMHYRTVDVSTVKELCRRWAPKIAEGAPSKKRAHRALDDIKESVQELKYYKRYLFKQH